MDESVKKISDIYELIDLYCGASIAGEKVEIIVTPRKDNPNEREITIGLQGGLSRDRDTFIVKNGLLFDSQILPQIMEHYSYGDQFNPDWNIVLTTQKEATSKAVLETESGNLLYIETYNNNIFDRLKNKKVEEPEKVASITPEQKDWEKIIEYAKERNVMQDFFERGNLTDEETKNLRELLTILSDIREFVPKTRREHRNEIAKNVEILLNAQEWSEELVKIGIDRETYEKTSELLANGLNEKILGTALTEKFARLVQNERKLNLYIQTRSKKDKEFSKEKFQAKVKFAISELSKKDYFELRNASEEVHEEHKLDKKYGRNCPGAIASLKERYEKNEDPEITTEEQRNEYITYCDELLEYLEAKAKSIKNKPRKENTDIEFVPYLPNEMVETYNSEYTDEESFVQLLDRIDLCKAGRINNEKFELIIEHHPEDKNKRLVRLSLTDGVSRHDDFYFDFKNGVEFDQRINEIIDRVSENDEIKNRDEIPVNVPGEIDRTTTMLTTNEGNEILIKLDNYQQSLPGKTVEPEPIGPVGPEDPPTAAPAVSKAISLSKEDRELANYFRLNILRNAKKLPPVGLEEIERLESVNERVTALEEARRRFEDGKLTGQEYDRIYDEYRRQLATAIKNAARNKKEEREEKVEITATAKTEEEPIKKEEKSKKLNLKQEDRELADYFRKNILRNAGQLPPIGLSEIERLASVNERVAALEEARRRFEDGRLSAKEYDLLYDEFRTELSIAIKEASKENKEEAEKEVETTATAKTEEEPTRVEERAKGLNLKQEDRELAEYFRKNILRNRKQLPPVGLAEIERLASVNERVAALEEARRRFEDGRLSAKEYDLLYDEFRTELSIAIKEAAKENTNNQEITPPLMKHKIKKQKNLDDEANELAQYFRYEILRNDGQLSPSGLKEIERLSQTNEKVSALEEAHKRLENGKLSQESFDRVHAHYRKYLSDQMKKSNRKNEEPKQEEKNSLASKVQHSLKELERRLIEAINKRLEVKKNEKVEKTKFDDLHDLFREYKAVTINGETKIVNRNTNEKYNPNSKDEELDIEFAAFWESIAGIKATPGDVDLGEQYAFNEEAKILFNIMDIQYNESLSRDIPIDYESMRSLFENSKHEKGEEIYERLFSNPDNREFILDYYAKKLNKKSNKDNTKKEEKPNKEKEDLKKLKEEILELKEMVSNEQKKKKEDKDINSDVIEEIFNEEKKDKDINSDVIEEVTDEEKVNKDFIKKLEDKINEVLKSKKEEEKQEEVVEQETINPAIEIRDSYEVAASYSSFERPASLKIFFVKDNPEQVEIIISNGQGNDEEVLYQKTFTPEEVMGEMLEQICEVYIEENGMTYNQTFDVPNTNKAGSITLGENDNVLQMSNAPKEYVKKLQENLEKAFKNLKKKTTGKKK